MSPTNIGAVAIEVHNMTDDELAVRIAEYWCHMMATEDEEMFRSLKQDYRLLAMALEQRRARAGASS